MNVVYGYGRERDVVETKSNVKKCKKKESPGGSALVRPVLQRAPSKLTNKPSSSTIPARFAGENKCGFLCVQYEVFLSARTPTIS